MLTTRIFKTIYLFRLPILDFHEGAVLAYAATAVLKSRVRLLGRTKILYNVMQIFVDKVMCAYLQLKANKYSVRYSSFFLRWLWC